MDGRRTRMPLIKVSDDAVMKAKMYKGDMKGDMKLRPLAWGGRKSRQEPQSPPPSMAPKAAREDFKPAIEWAEDSSNRLLHVQLPGFKREDIKVQLDSAGTLLIKGSRQVSDNKYLDVDQSFDVPDDTITEKISGRLEDGRLTFIMPKKVVEEQEATREAEAIQEEKPYTGEEKKEEEEEEEEKDEAESFTEDKKDAKTGGLVGLWIRKWISDRTGAEDSWLDSGSLDCILEKLNRNRKVIAVAVVAFTVGLFVSQRLRTRGKGDMDTFVTIYCVISHCKVM